jgi:hypothetical protein
MTTPLRVRRSRLSGHRLPANTICVSRGTRWGNPYRVGYDGDAECCVRKYRDYLLPYSHKDGDLSGFLRAEANVKAIQNDLRGLNLACWCELCPKHADGKPFGEQCQDCAPCHADVLGAIANSPLLEQENA